MQLLDLLVLHLITKLLFSDLAMQLIDLSTKLSDQGLTILDLTGDVQDTFVFLLDL